MNVRQRFSTALKVLTNSNLGNSLGSVLHNYTAEDDYHPRRQLKGITYKAVDKIGLSLSVYEPRIKKNAEDVYVNHPMLNLFGTPNDLQNNASDFIHLYGMLYEIYGETFWYFARGEKTGKPKQVWLLNPAQIELKIYEGELVGYVLHKSNGEQVPFTLDEIIHDKRPNPFNEWRGQSILEKASTYIDIEYKSARFTLNYINNNASPSGIVTLPDMDKEVFKQFATQWREGYEGPENAGKTAFIRGGTADFKAVGATLKDIDMKITRDMAKDDVLMMLDIPKPLLGLTDDNGFGRGNVETLNYIFAKEKLEPMMRRLDRIYEETLKRFFATAGGNDVTHVSPIPEDKEFIHKTNKELVNVAVTVNEVRSKMGLPPLEDPMFDTIQPKNAVQDPMPVEVKSYKKVVLKSEKTQKTKKDKSIQKIEVDSEKFRLRLVKTSETYANKLKRIITQFAEKQEKKVIARINASGKLFEEWLFNVKDDSEKLAELSLPLMIELMEAQAEDTSNFITGELISITPELKREAEVNIKRIAGSYNQDTIKALEKTLSEGTKNGESLAKLKKRVEATYSDAKGYRAERIARTETLKASNKAAELSYNQNGFKTVAWFVNPDACQFCQTFAGQTKEIGGKFLNIGDVITGADEGTMAIEYDDIEVPPLHPNCTCSLVPVD